MPVPTEISTTPQQLDIITRKIFETVLNSENVEEIIDEHTLWEITYGESLIRKLNKAKIIENYAWQKSSYDLISIDIFFF